jgi:hypothetical protein
LDLKVRLLAIGLLSILLFFPIYIGLHPLLGANWAAGIAAVFMYVLLPVFFLFLFPKEWRHPLVKAGNYLIAIAVLWVSFFFLEDAFTRGEEEINAIRFFWVYGVAALYYLAFGRMRWSELDEDESQ